MKCRYSRTHYPGFRDLRGPLTAGYLWLFFAWLLAKPDLDKRPRTEPAATVYELADHAGPIALALAVGVVAYLVGAMSVGVDGLIYRFVNRVRVRLTSARFDFVPGSPEAGFRFGVHLTGWHAVDQVLQQAVLDVSDSVKRNRRSRSESEWRELLDDFESIVASRVRDCRREFSLPATLFVGEQQALFAEVDRLRSEGELRQAVGLPLSAILIVLGTYAAWW